LSLLAGCTGGGGGGAGGGGGGISLSPSSLSFTADHDSGSAPPTQSVTITAQGQSLFIGVEDVSGVATANALLCPGGSTCTLEIGVPWPGTCANPGTYTGSVTVIACPDVSCLFGVVPNGRKTVNVSYTITPGFDVAPAPSSFNVPSLQFITAEGVAAGPQAFTLTHPSGTVQSWFTILSYDVGATDWLTLTPASNASSSPSGSTVQVSAATFPVGTHRADVVFRPGTSGRVLLRTVIQTVLTALKVSSDRLEYVVDNSTVPGQVQKTLTIGTNYAPGTGGTLGWQATANVPWLSLSTMAGDTANQNQIVVSLIAEKIERLPAGQYQGQIVITPTTAGLTPIRIFVSLDMQLPLVESVAPYVARAGESAMVYIRGSGLARLPGSVLFGNAPATTAIRDGDTQIRATHPPLAAGTYPVDVGIGANALGLNRNRATLVVLEQTTLPATAIASAGAKWAVVYDDERRAIYASDVDNNEIKRYRWNGSGWDADALAIATLRDISLFSGGRQLLALSDDSVVHIDLASFQISETHDSPLAGTQPNTKALVSLAVGNSGEVIVVRGNDSGFDTNVAFGTFHYDTALGLFSEEFFPSFFFANGYARASGDGSRIVASTVLPFTVTGPSPGYVYTYDTFTRSASRIEPGPMTARAVSASRDGTKFIVNVTDVRNATSLVGRLNAGEFLIASQISPDGTRAYAFGESGTLYTFNLNAPIGAGFAQIGGGIAFANLDVGTLVMTTSADGQVVFVATSNRVIVQPVP